MLCKDLSIRGHINRDKDIIPFTSQRAVENATLHATAPAANGAVLQLLLRQRDHRAGLIEVLHADCLAVVSKRAVSERV